LRIVCTVFDCEIARVDQAAGVLSLLKVSTHFSLEEAIDEISGENDVDVPRTNLLVAAVPCSRPCMRLQAMYLRCGHVGPAAHMPLHCACGMFLGG